MLNKIKNKIRIYKEIYRQFSDEKTVFIYQMGKVGSTTLDVSLPDAIHIHAFYSKNHTCPARQLGLAKFGLMHFIYRIDQEIELLIKRLAFKKRIDTKIITLVRQPLERNISMFFHDLDAYLFAAHTNCMNTRKVALPTRNQEHSLLADVFNHEFNHEYPLTWFDVEFKRMTGIDVFKYPFDKSKGIVEINERNVNVLCVRTDKLNNSLASISHFVGDEIVLANANQASDKWYTQNYTVFKNTFELPEVTQEQLLTSKYYRHFFE